MFPKFVIVCLFATAFVATTALMPPARPLLGVMFRNRGPGTGAKS